MASRTPAAVRQARRRARERQGLSVFKIEVEATTIEMLINIGWLSDDESRDPGKVAAALGEALKLWARGVA
jgi:hypothetical protein